MQAEEKTSTLQTILDNTSHEIRTLLSSVIGMTGLLLDADLRDDQRRYAEVVRASGESLLTLITHILDLSKIESGKLDLEDLDFDLRSLHDLHRPNIRVLLAEDNITNQQVAMGILRKLGLHADAVANGLDVLDILRRIPYDLVFMDIQMPEMDGLAATRAIRAGGNGILNPRVPIIAMTARAMQGDREECLKSGMDGYIAKPVTPEALMRLIEGWLAKLEAEIKAAEQGGAA